MKKLLSFFVALIMSVACACAQDWSNHGSLRISPPMNGNRFALGTVFYTINNKYSNGYLRSDQMTGTSLSMRAASTSEDAGRWAIIGSTEKGFQFVNKATKQAVAMSKDFSHSANPNDTAFPTASSLTTDYSDANTFFDIAAHKTATNYWVITAHNDHAYFWNDLKTLGYWYSEANWGWVGWQGDGYGDDGASFRFSMVEEVVLKTYTFILPEDVTVSYDQQTYSNGNTVVAVGDVDPKDVFVDQAAPDGYKYGVSVDRSAKTVTVSLKEDVVLSFDDIDLNKSYYIYTTLRGGLTVTDEDATTLIGTNHKDVQQEVDKHDPRQQFAFVKIEGNYYLYNIGAGKFLISSSNGALKYLPKDPIQIVAGTNNAKGTAAFRFSSSMRLSIGGGNTAVIDSWMWDDAGNCFYIKPAESIDSDAIIASLKKNVTVPSAGYSTFYHNKTVAIPEGMTAYALSENPSGWLDAAPVEKVIPARCGVLLKAEEGNFTLNVTDDAAPEATSCLSGVLVDTPVGSNVFVFNVVNDVPGFYNFAGSTLMANKAYYVSSSNSNSIAVRFADEVSGIDFLAPQDGAQPIYDLQGRRVNSNAKGVFIHNGKKVIK